MVYWSDNVIAQILKSIFGLLFFAATCHAQVSDKRQPETVSDVIEIIHEQRAKLFAMRVKYFSETKLDEVLIKQGRLGGVRTRADVEFAFSGDRRHVTKESSGLLNNGSPTRDPVSTTVFSGGECRYRQGKMLTILMERSANCEMNAYTSAMRWPITEAEIENSATSADVTHFLPQMLSAQDWILLDSEEQVNGESCITLTNDRLGRRLSLAANKGFALVHFFHKDPVEEIDYWKSDFFEFELCKGGIWLPKRIVGVNAYKATPTLSGGKAVTTLLVEELDVNEDVDDALFVLEPRPGELVKDEKKGTIARFIPVSDGSLDNSIAEAKSRQTSSPVPDGNRPVYLFLGAAIGIGIICAIQWITQGRRTTAKM